MAQVAPAITADDLSAMTVGIRNTCYSPGNLIIKTWPAAAGIKFILRVVQRRIATPAHVNTCLFVIGILARKRPFGSFMNDHSFFFRGQFVVIHIIDCLANYIRRTDAFGFEKYCELKVNNLKQKYPNQAVVFIGVSKSILSISSLIQNGLLI